MAMTNTLSVTIITMILSLISRRSSANSCGRRSNYSSRTLFTNNDKRRRYGKSSAVPVVPAFSFPPSLVRRHVIESSSRTLTSLSSRRRRPSYHRELMTTTTTIRKPPRLLLQSSLLPTNRALATTTTRCLSARNDDESLSSSNATTTTSTTTTVASWDNDNNPPSSSTIHLRITTDDDMQDVGSLLSLSTGKGDVIFLDGDLGAGKTCLARGFIRARLGDMDMRVPSPTYLLSNAYDCIDGGGDDRLTIHHMDLYRLSGSAKDLEVLDMSYVLSECISLVEWPSRLPRTIIPDERLDIDIKVGHVDIDTDDNDDDDGVVRYVTLTPHGRQWQTRLQFLIEEGYLDDLMIDYGDDDVD